MKEISKYLYKFIDQEFLQNNTSKTFWKSRNLNHENMDTFIRHAINDIQNVKLAWDSHRKNIKETLLPQPQIPKGNMYSIIPKVARECIESRPTYGKQFHFTIEHQSIELTIVYVFAEDDDRSRVDNGKMNAFFNECLYKIFMWLSYAHKYKHAECSQTLKIYLYLTDLFKILPEKNDSVIDVDHANTAFTTSCSPSTEINIFRDEEWFKVFIHESFHCLGFDFSHLHELCSQSTTRMLELFNVKSEVNLFETWCEMWGELFNIIIYCVIHASPGKSTGTIIKKIYSFLKYEQIFSLFQCVKVLQHQNLNYRDIITKPKHDLYKEKTNVLSYYIIKSILMFHIADFFDFVVHHNQSSLVFVQSLENIHGYCDLIKKKYNTTDYLFVIENIEKWWNGCRECKLENITMRMCVLEW